MPERPSFGHFENGDDKSVAFTESDLDFLTSFGIQAVNQLGETDKVVHDFDLALYRGAYVDAMNHRSDVITAYVNDRANRQLAGDIEGTEELAYAYFRSYIGTLLHAPAAVSIDTAGEFTSALGLADASQAAINQQTRNNPYRFNIEVLQDHMANIVAATHSPERTQEIIEKIYKQNIYDVALGFVRSNQS